MNTDKGFNVGGMVDMVDAEKFRDALDDVHPMKRHVPSSTSASCQKFTAPRCVQPFRAKRQLASS